MLHRHRHRHRPHVIVRVVGGRRAVAGKRSAAGRMARETGRKGAKSTNAASTVARVGADRDPALDVAAATDDRIHLRQ